MVYPAHPLLAAHTSDDVGSARWKLTVLFVLAAHVAHVTEPRYFAGLLRGTEADGPRWVTMVTGGKSGQEQAVDEVRVS